MDAQAADRAHRIGQTKPVLIFRLVSKHTIETRIMQRAAEKRQLEALVIAKGKFKAPTAAVAKGKPETMAELAATLLRLEGEQIEVVPADKVGRERVLSDEDLETLLDRRPEVFSERTKGWTGGAAEVFEAPVDTSNSALANMLGEPESE
jgi:ATP-dependent DNA helicase